MVNSEFGSLGLFFGGKGALFFHFTAQHMYENILYGRHFQRLASFGICKIPPLFSEVRFSVIKGSSFRNLYGVKFVVRQ